MLLASFAEASLLAADRIKVLKEMIEHHAAEEESDMFPEARKSMSDEQLQQLGERMAKRKKELEKS